MFSKSQFKFISQLFSTLIITIGVSSICQASDSVPGAPQKKPIVLVEGTVHTVSGDTIENGMVLFDKGKIVRVGESIDIPGDAQVINCRGKQIYPGLIESHSQIGLVEIGAVRATRDQSELGTINPNVKALISVNPDSEIIPVTRSNGVLAALTVPSGGLISGRASVIQLDGWTYENMKVKSDVAMQINWPRLSRTGRSRRGSSQDTSSGMREIREFFDTAKSYLDQTAKDDTIFQKSDPRKFDIRLDAMKPVLQGEMPILVRANGLSEIQSAVAFASERKLKLIIFGGYDAEKCAELLKKHDVPVIVSAIYRNPLRRHDDYDSAYTLPKRLKDAGVKYCISGSDKSETWNVRILPYHAATAIAYGLELDEALKAITLYPAQILGVDKQLGSLEPGKDATLFIADGDIFEIKSNVEAAYIQGRKVDMSDKHKRLYNKYKQRYQQKK